MWPQEKITQALQIISGVGPPPLNLAKCELFSVRSLDVLNEVDDLVREQLFPPLQITKRSHAPNFCDPGSPH